MDSPTSLYVVEQGAHVHRVAGRLLVRDSRGVVLQDVPLFRLERVLLLGSVEVTSSAFVHLAREGIDLVYLTKEGRFLARGCPLGAQATETRLAQYRLAQDDMRKLELARKVVAAKIGNSRAVLRRRSNGTGEEDAKTRARLKLLADEALTAASVESLMGIEGTAAREYFGGLRRNLKQDLGFEGRNRRPPKDPVNALLSFGYTLLFGQVLSAIQAAALDPYLGNLHEVKQGRPSLALDLMEEVRCLVDTLVMRAINRIELTARDFVDAGEAGTRMTDAGLARYVKLYHERMAETSLHGPSGRTVDYREFGRLQALSYRAWVRGEGEYVPMEWR
ncbi:MAG: CRISPR-associated endonuclease Cas1 [Candidatus Riflebacteria bacterium]|nr:CRISPR-associated endonuclease Cas1 [Candidatus Riflebacteria bacterium]